jgi:hypothetical protein
LPECVNSPKQDYEKSYKGGESHDNTLAFHGSILTEATALQQSMSCDLSGNWPDIAISLIIAHALAVKGLGWVVMSADKVQSRFFVAALLRMTMLIKAIRTAELRAAGRARALVPTRACQPRRPP